jgi:hypothetical protein
MPSARTLARLDALAWALIYGGLFTLVLGIASHGETAIGGWSLSVLGTIAAIAGVVTIVIRARLPQASETGTANKDTETRA